MTNFLDIFKTLTILMLLTVFTSAKAVDFLEPNQAFKLTTTKNEKTINVHFEIAKGYHLYQDQIKITSDKTQWAPLSLPKAKETFDSNINAKRMVYEYPSLDFKINLNTNKPDQPITIHWQGCAEEGLCYAPEEMIIPIENKSLAPFFKNATQPLLVDNISENIEDNSLSTPISTPEVSITSNTTKDSFTNKNILEILISFGLSGILLSLTPCMLPMLPILASIIFGQKNNVSKKRNLSLASTYILGMSIVYACFGVLAGLAGEGLAASLQNPIVLSFFAIILCILASSMFGFFELQMPSIIQQKINNSISNVKGGNYIGVFILGGLSSLIIGPCMAAPLAGALVYISQTKDVVLGGLALFTLALGMGVPLLLMGLSAEKLLPKTGPWMKNVNTAFGLILIGVAINVISPIISNTILFLLCATWLLILAFLLYKKLNKHNFRHISILVTLATSLCLIGGAATGGTSLLNPLNNTDLFKSENGIVFKKIKNIEELDKELLISKNNNEITMLDFYADWCVACKEYENITFKNNEVINSLKNVKKLQVDVTANTTDDKALMKRFKLFGPPGIVFFNPDTTQNSIVIGYEGPNMFLKHINTNLK